MRKFTKDICHHPEFYISRFTKHQHMPYLLFIHGGPGLNSATLEYLIEHHNLFDDLDHNIILYDQRSCGRSVISSKDVLHEDNVNDLHDIIDHLTVYVSVEIHGLIGHSYGAKLLYDYYAKFNSIIPGIFISTANSILIPRLNSLISLSNQQHQKEQ